MPRREWAKKVTDEAPDFFTEMAKGQTPEYLWIGCADSRVTVRTVRGLLGGEPITRIYC